MQYVEGHSTPKTAVWLFVCSAKGYKISRLETIITRQTTPPSTTSCCIRIQCPASTHHPLYVSVDVEDSLSRDFQEWYIPDKWPSSAFDILNEQALEERTHPLMISDPPVCLCFYWMFTLLTPTSGVAHLRQLVRECLYNSRRASLCVGRPEDG